MEINQDCISVLKEHESIIEESILLNQYSFWVKDIPFKISVKTYLDIYRDNDPYRFALSHYLHSPTQAGCYTPSAPFASNESIALSMALDAIFNFYKGAKNEGHSPKESWFKANEDF